MRDRLQVLERWLQETVGLKKLAMIHCGTWLNERRSILAPAELLADINQTSICNHHSPFWETISEFMDRVDLTPVITFAIPGAGNV